MKWEAYTDFCKLELSKGHSNPDNIREALEMIEEKNPIIVEVGVSYMEWEQGGCTWAFASFAREKDGTYIGIDADPESILKAKDITKDFTRTIFMHGDAFTILPAIDAEVSLLFLDAWGEQDQEAPASWNNTVRGAKAYLELFHISRIRPKLVFIDNVYGDNERGKGIYLIPYLLANGYELIFMKEERALLRRKDEKI